MNAQELETALFNIFERDVRQKREPRCEREVEVWGIGRYFGPCGSSGAKFYQSAEFEGFLCDGCAEEAGLL